MPASASLTRSRVGQSILAALAAVALSCLLFLTGMLDGFEARTFDWRARILAGPNPATPPIRIIFLDQQSLDWGSVENGLSWPWPREVYGAVVDFCRRAEAGSLAFDVLFTEPSKYGVSDDQVLGQAGKEFGRMVLPLFLGRETGEARSWPGFWTESKTGFQNSESLAALSALLLPDLPRASFPIEELAAQAAVLGNVHQNPDPDGVYRRIGLFALFDGRVVPSLSLAAYLAAHPDASLAFGREGLALDGRALAVDRFGQALIRYHEPQGTYRSYSAAAIIQSELLMREGLAPVVEPDEFRGAYVFFGFSAPGLFDLRPVPVSGVYSGVEVHAQTLGNILAGNFLREVRFFPSVILAAGLALAAALCCLLRPSTAYFLVAVALFVPLPVALACWGYASGYVLPLMMLETSTGLALGASILIGYATEGRQKRFIKSAFRQYLSPVVIEQLLRHPERMKLGGERRTLSIFFSDLQGFTGLAEKLSPEDLTQFLNEYLTAMTDIIMDEGGTVDKYEGDAIIAFWNAPLDQPDHADRALRAALRCQDRLAELRPIFHERIGADVFMRIGLNTGPAVVGNMGSHSRFDYTMLGDSVNLAARLEGINKQFGTYTLISEAMLQATSGIFAARELGRVVVVGRGEAVTVFEPMWPDRAHERKADLDRFSRALSLYYAGDAAAALVEFEILAGGDLVAASYVEQCRIFLQNPPGPEWNGVRIMTSK
jgi:adenylate cyclase